MAQDNSVSPLSFFSDFQAKQTGDARHPQNADEEAFGAALQRASQTTAHEQRKPDYTMDKPKVNSHEPFFPRKPMPYHADEAEAQPAQMPGDARMQGPQSMAGTASYDDADSGMSDSSVDSSYGRGVRRPADADDMDDRDGTVGKSYDGAAVSYPMSRIAKQSLDEKTKEALQEQGLWNLPTMVMAQPTPKMQSMGMVTAEMKSKAMPVSKPIAQFMASLENELGVSPDRLVKAFQNLPPGALQASPEKTMALVVKNLGLNQGESAKAMQLYSKMLAQMQLMDGKEKLQLAAALGGATGGLKGAANAEQMEAAADQKLASKSEFEGIQDSVNKGMHLKEADASKDKSPDNLGTLRPNGYEANAKAAAEAADNGVFSAKAEVAAQAKADSLNLNQIQNQNQNQSQDQNQSGAQSQNQSNRGQNGMFANGAAANLAAHKGEGSVKDQVKFDLKHDVQADANGVAKQTDVTNVASQSQQTADVKAPHNAATLGEASATGAAAEMRASAHAKNEAIQSIINNAQMLSQKGGGEMHMTLKPEHLGEIQLRVAVEGNHVNVQMTTEKGEVKKLIEQGVHELRHGLAQHNLSMAKLDVSVGDKSAGNLKQGMPDFAQAREFAQQFHQQNGRREMLSDLSALRSNAFAGAQSAASRMGSSSRMSTASNSARGTGRLNVVA